MGFGILLDQSKYLNLYYGLEFHKQAGFTSSGNTLFTNGAYSDNFANTSYSINADHLSSSRSLNRKYQLSNMNFSMNSFFDQENSVQLNLSFYDLFNDIVQRSNGEDIIPDVETEKNNDTILI